MLKTMSRVKVVGIAAVGAALSLMTRPVKSALTLPSAVRAVLPRGAVSVDLERLPIGPNGTPILAHLWTVERPQSPANASPPFQIVPFCLDLFEPATGANNWSFVNAVVYGDYAKPGKVFTRWLQPKQKLGAVIIIASSTGYPGLSTTLTLIAFPYGLASSSYQQAFSAGGSGGGGISYTFDGIDARGYLTATRIDYLYGKQKRTVLTWNGHEFVEPAPHQ